MKKLIIYTLVTILVILILSSNTTQSSQFYYLHFYSPENGTLIDKKIYGVIEEGVDTISYYQCPPGTEFSCKVDNCVPIGSVDTCDCVIGQ